MDIKSSLYGMEFDLDYRRSGKTHRVVANAIQILFKEGVVRVEDHDRWDGRKATFDENKRLFRMVMVRLRNEHNISLSMDDFKDGCVIIPVAPLSKISDRLAERNL